MRSFRPALPTLKCSRTVDEEVWVDLQAACEFNGLSIREEFLEEEEEVLAITSIDAAGACHRISRFVCESDARAYTRTSTSTSSHIYACTPTHTFTHTWCFVAIILKHSLRSWAQLFRILQRGAEMICKEGSRKSGRVRCCTISCNSSPSISVIWQFPGKRKNEWGNDWGPPQLFIEVLNGYWPNKSVKSQRSK